MNDQGNSFESLRYALRALRREFLQFRFNYPLDIDADAGQKAPFTTISTARSCRGA